MLSIVAVAMAGVAFVATRPGADRARGHDGRRRPRADATPDAAMPTAKPEARQAGGRKGKVYVEVYNNSGITGLAGRSAATATQAGWQVVGSDNWYGTIPASTVYYPPRLEAAARALALDLGIRRRPRRSTRCGSTGSRSSSPPTTPDRFRATRGVRARLEAWSSPRPRASSGTPTWSRRAPDVVVGLDFDGTLSPIVDDPEAAHIHPDAPQVLVDLAGAVRAVAVITGRPARQALALGGLDEVGDAIGDTGSELYLFGQYGNERWSSTNRRIVSPAPAARAGHVRARAARGCCGGADAADAFVEDKGLAVAVHTRRLADPDAAFDRLLPAARRARRAARPDRRARPPGDRGPLARHAQGPGRRAPGRGARGRRLPVRRRRPRRPRGVRGGRRLRRRGLPTLLVCSASEEESALADLADVVVNGPDGVLDLLRQLTRRRRLTAPTPDVAERPAWPGLAACGRGVHIVRRLRRVADSSSRGTEGTAL